MDPPSGDLDPALRDFFARLAAARRIAEVELEALLRLAEVDGDAAALVRDAVRGGHLFGAGVRDLVGRHSLHGRDLAAFILRDVVGRPQAEVARALGCDARTLRRRLGAARGHLGLPVDAPASVIGQWTVTELIAPPARVLQLRLFRQGENDEQGTVQGEDRRQAGLAVEEGEPRP